MTVFSDLKKKYLYLKNRIYAQEKTVDKLTEELTKKFREVAIRMTYALVVICVAPKLTM